MVLDHILYHIIEAYMKPKVKSKKPKIGSQNYSVSCIIRGMNSGVRGEIIDSITGSDRQITVVYKFLSKKHLDDLMRLGYFEVGSVTEFWLSDEELKTRDKSTKKNKRI